MKTLRLAVLVYSLVALLCAASSCQAAQSVKAEGIPAEQEKCLKVDMIAVTRVSITRHGHYDVTCVAKDVTESYSRPPAAPAVRSVRLRRFSGQYQVARCGRANMDARVDLIGDRVEIVCVDSSSKDRP